MKSPVVLLREHGLAAKKGFGQNFLTDPNLCRKIADIARGEGDSPLVESVLEIGPGLGALTEALLERTRWVTAIERDPDMLGVLRKELAPSTRSEGPRPPLTLLEGDGLIIDWKDATRGLGPTAVCGNLPYLVTGRFLERAVSEGAAFARYVFMVQLEVADRIIASPGNKTYGALSVFVQAAFVAEKALTVRAGAFHPRPEVDSAIIRLTPRPHPIVESSTFRALVKGAFAMRRKTLRNAWSHLPGHDGARVAEAAESEGIDLTRRGETLSPSEYERMGLTLDRLAGPPQPRGA